MALFDQNFLLTNPTACRLYHGYAAGQPIVDYHCHISPQEIWEDRRFENMTQLWLEADHYKWRLMRWGGVEERYITGDATDREKFQKFAEILPRAAGNPLFSWCHLELKNYFGWEGILTGATAQEVWELAEERMREDPAFSARGLIRRSGVVMVGTTDDPCDDLRWHKRLAEDERFSPRVYPTFRPDKAFAIGKAGFREYLLRLGEVSGCPVERLEDVRRALTVRLESFVSSGCRAADHSFERVPFHIAGEWELDGILRRALKGETVTAEEAESYQTALLLHCAGEYARLGLVMQLHCGCLRNPSTRLFSQLGPDAGGDAIAPGGGSCSALPALLDNLDRAGTLPRTILYSLDPGQNAFLEVLAGSFQTGGVPGKIQHGSAWWFNDTRAGMEEQLAGLAARGLLGSFVGMLTDSRSFLSYARHEYFRRILCDLLGRWVEAGEYPDDDGLLGNMVEDLCWRNAWRYFSL